MSDQEIRQLDEDIKRNQKLIDRGAALDRLFSNRDFKRIVVEGYINEEAVRLVHAKANPGLQNEAAQKAIVRDIDAIGSLNQYLHGIIRNAAIAQRDNQNNEAARDELIEEQTLLASIGGDEGEEVSNG